MFKILVVDDTAFDRRLVTSILEKNTNYTVECAVDGLEAMDAICDQDFDLVVTDLNMPNVDGLTLVRQIHSQFPNLPTIVMTAYGSEATAMRALQSGAYRYVPKFHLQDELVAMADAVLKTTARDRNEKELLCSVVEHSIKLSLPNDCNRIAPTIEYLQRLMDGMKMFDGSNAMHLSVALDEAITNAIIHGNLEVSSKLRQRDDNAYGELIQARSQMAPYADRRVSIDVNLTPRTAKFIIRDEGPGFDLSQIANPEDPENLLKPSGRGITLMHAFLDKVTYNEIGNEVTLILNVADQKSEAVADNVEAAPCV